LREDAQVWTTQPTAVKAILVTAPEDTLTVKGAKTMVVVYKLHYTFTNSDGSFDPGYKLYSDDIFGRFEQTLFTTDAHLDEDIESDHARSCYMGATYERINSVPPTRAWEMFSDDPWMDEVDMLLSKANYGHTVTVDAAEWGD
jgi:hypothetical protein